ncbi:4Fe-4S dicluster domain-containing protein [Thermus amyloliquefaciens]|uniref:4Fe-4S dicluster domain-containing protein n=1 Tax=Thermus amyloliquefaciens TaxID=1449080 RepID=UPI00056DA162|nr:4Fe-4S dicluster domain-containing protein [Thermus amyloliquefaciens]
MGFLDNLLNAFLKATDPRPRYTEARCLLYKNSVGGCDRCYQVCPKGAVQLESFRVELDEVLCTGCGLCTGVCPGIALEYPLGGMQEALIRGKGQIRCSKAEGKGEEVLCLGRLTPGLLAEAGSRFGKLILARGECATCKIGGPSVPEHLQRMVAEAQRYHPVEVEVIQGELPGEKVGRRELFQALLGSAKRTAADLVPEPPLAAEPEEKGLPAELRLRRLAAGRAPGVRWPRIRVEEGCTLCPVCTNVCPTEAVYRVREGEEYVLRLKVEACTGCGACVESCPPQVIRLEEASKEEVTEELELYRGKPPWYDL